VKQRLEIGRAQRLINNGCAVLLSSQHQGRPNVMALAWHMPVSFSPPLVAVAVGVTRYTAEVIHGSREFVINVPGPALVTRVHYVGRVSGREVDKFDTGGLTPVEGAMVKAPLIKECLAHIECRVTETYEAGDHYIFLGEVLAAWADKGLFGDTWLAGPEGVATIHHLGGNFYSTGGRVLEIGTVPGAKKPPRLEDYLVKG